MKQKILVRSLIAAGVIAAGLGGYAKDDPSVFQHAAAASAFVPAVTLSAQLTTALPDFTGIVAQNGPAVVHISVTQKVEPTGSAPVMQGLDPGDPFYEYFRQFRVPIPRGQMPLQGIGSGFIVSPDGVVLTNAHVVNDAAEVTVKLTDKREFKANVIGIDKPTDVAVLKIDAKNLPTVKLDKADDVEVGEWVVAIGSPYGFENTVTSGIVSAKWRTLPGDSYVPFIQTDVAVNPGNSGGPLFNMRGEVIGINSQIYSRSGGYQGLSFSVPIDVALGIQDQLMQHGSVTRGRLGVAVRPLSPDERKQLGVADGLMVENATGPAANAGIQPGDMILSVNGTPVKSVEQLKALLSKAGKHVALLIQRDDMKRFVAIDIG